MQSKTAWLCLVFITIITSQIDAQSVKQDSISTRYFIGSSLFMLANLVPDDNAPDFAQLNLGYRFTRKDVISLEVKTWKYAWSLGIPYGKSFESPDEKFPGYIREKGFAMAYQRFLGNRFYIGIHVMNAWQTFVNDEGQKIDTGFQVFNTYRLGCHIKLFNDKFFLQPSIAITHRPIQTKMPESFQQLDDKWSKFFIGEPGLHFGYNF